MSQPWLEDYGTANERRKGRAASDPVRPGRLRESRARSFPSLHAGCHRRIASAELHLADHDLPTTYDRVLVAVFERGSGRHAAYFAMRPNGSTEDVADALRRSAGTVTAGK